MTIFKLIGRRARLAKHVGVAAAFGLACSGQPASAQTPTSMGFWQFSAGQVLAPYENPKTWRVTVGPTLSYQPKYEGSNHYEFQPGLTFEIRYRERYYLSAAEGLGYDVFRGRNYRAGASITYDLGRNDNVAELYGIGGVDPAPQFRIYGEYVFRPAIFTHEVPIILSVTAYRAIGGYDGFQGDIGLYAPIAGSVAKRWFIFLGGSGSLADNNTLDRYFGINALQAQRSGYPVYNPKSGFRSAGLGLDAGWHFKRHWLMSGSVGMKWLLSDAARSPLVREEFQLTGHVAIGYAF